MHAAYTLGATDALTHIGMSKLARGNLLRRLALPAAAGGGLGAVGGAMASTEGNRLQGALLGAGLGATGATLGHSIGGAVTARGTAQAEKAMAQDLAQAMKNKSGGKLYGAAATGRKTKYMQGPSRQGLESNLKNVTERGPRLQRGSTMLGGVGGTGAAMDLTSEP